jgi:glycosyltransferase involved in cell wall biosynthesis
MIVSVVVPVYNVEPYIERCFKSIAKQTYKDVECIFVDDASPDSCYEILKRCISQYAGEIEFKICRHSINRGLSEARNTGTLSSSGEYVYYLDSDDEIYEDCLARLVDLVKKYPGVDMVQGNTKTIPEPEPEYDWRNILFKGYPEYVEGNSWIKKYCFDEPRIPVNAWNKLVKKKFLLDNDLFFKKGIIHEDEHWMFFVSKEIKSIAFAVEYCYVHYVVPGSIMQSGSSYKSVESMLVILEELLRFVDDVHSVSQRRYIYRAINGSMIKALRGDKENELIGGYFELVKKIRGESFFLLSIVDVFILSVFLSPEFFYKSRVGQKLLSVLMARL